MNATSSFTGNETNTSAQASSPCYVDDPDSVKTARVFAYSFLILISLLGNTFVIAAIYKYGGRRKTINYAVINMAVANLCITTVYMPRLIPMFLVGTIWLVGGGLGYALCKIVPFVHGVAIIASVLILLGTSLDTFCAVVFPLKKLFTIRVARVTVFLTWFLAIIMRLPYFLALRTKTSTTGKQTCGSSLNQAFNNENARDIYYTFLFVAFYALPWLAILIFYSIIAIRLKTASIPQQETITAFRVNRARARATRNVIRMMIIITTVFIVCWITYFLAQIAFRTVPCSFRFWRLFLAHCNCAINPILFAVFNTTVRRAIKDVFHNISVPGRRLCVCDAFISSIVRRKAIKKRKVYISPKEQTHGHNAPAFVSISAEPTVNLSEITRKTAPRQNRINGKEIGIVNRGKQDDRDSGNLNLNSLTIGLKSLGEVDCQEGSAADKVCGRRDPSGQFELNSKEEI